MKCWESIEGKYRCMLVLFYTLSRCQLLVIVENRILISRVFDGT